MCDKTADNHELKFVPYCYITKKMCDKAVNAHPSIIKFIPNAANRCFFVLDCIPNWYKIEEMCDRVASEDPFMIIYCLNR